MADDVVDLSAYRDAELLYADVAQQEAFLLDEGLELISAYRQIADPAIRRALYQFAKTLAGLSTTGI